MACSGLQGSAVNPYAITLNCLSRDAIVALMFLEQPTTRCFNLRPVPKEGIQAWCCRPGEKHMAHEVTGAVRESDNVV